MKLDAHYRVFGGISSFLGVITHVFGGLQPSFFMVLASNLDGNTYISMQKKDQGWHIHMDFFMIQLLGS